MQRWHTAAVTRLAPDERSVAAALPIAEPRRWTDVGCDDRAVWGTYLGTTGQRPFRVMVDLPSTTTSCSCPSRKVPCKHALALLYLWAGQPEAVPPGDPPEKVAAWLRQADERQGRRRQRSTVSTAAREARDRAIADGAAELRRWLDDLARRGLAAAQREREGFWDTAAARMVDAKAPGLARAVRRIRDATVVGDHAAALAAMARLHLLLAAHERRDDLPAELAEELRSLSGHPTPTRSVLAEGEQVDDAWVTLARWVEEDERLVTRRTWLRGEGSGRFALLLDFGRPGEPLPPAPQPFTVVEGPLAFYPGAVPERALLGETTDPAAARPHPHPPAGRTVAEARRDLADLLARDPFRRGAPVVLRDVTLQRDGDRWVLGDADGDRVVCQVGEWGALRILAVTGGRPGTVFGHLGRGGLAPRAAWPGPDGEGRPLLVAPATAVRGDGGDDDSPLAPLLPTAVVGVEHGPPPAIALPPALAAAVDDAAPPERRLLTAAALVDTAATVAVDDPRPVGAAPDPSPAPPEPCPVAPPRAAAALHQLLASGGQVPVAPLLAGWLTTARARGWRVPPHLLPAVLATIEDDPSALPPDAAALGDRAVWLLAATRALPRTAERLLPPPPAPTPEEARRRWATGSRDERTELLQRVRAHDPDLGRELVASTWEQDGWEDRAAALPVLATGLSGADEPLLERAAADGRKPVRRAATDLLARLPSSALAQRMAGRARQMVVRDGRRHLQVTPPARHTAELDADGVDPVAPRGLGVRAWLLRQAVAATPLAVWADHLDASPGTLVALDAREWTADLHAGWAAAARRQRDVEWAAELLLAGLLDPDLLALVPATVAEEALRRRIGEVHVGTLVQLAATHLPVPWGQGLSAALIDEVVRPTAAVRLVGAVAARAHPATLPRLRSRAQAAQASAADLVVAARLQLAAALDT